jgi:hypothetical protein
MGDNLIERLRAMVSKNGRAIVCDGRSTASMGSDILAAADALEALSTQSEDVEKEAREVPEGSSDSAAERVACRFAGISYSVTDLVIAQRAACAIVPLYGEGGPGEQEAARLGKLWNDHPAVQGALRALHEARTAAQRQNTAPGVSREEVARIIDPDAWNDSETTQRARTLGSVSLATRERDNFRKSALAKADAIISLLQPKPVAGERGV